MPWPPTDGRCEEDVVGYLTGDLANPSSVRSAIAAVHQNLRVTRSVMPIEAVEVLTELHCHVEDTADEAVDRKTRNAWLTSVIRSSQSLSAILAETMSHDDAYCFFTIGRQLERADLTTRVLDVQQGVLTRSQRGPLEPYLDICWFAVLRSVSALQAFRRTGTQGSAEATVAFLLHDTQVPAHRRIVSHRSGPLVARDPRPRRRHGGLRASPGRVGRCRHRRTRRRWTPRFRRPRPTAHRRCPPGHRVQLVCSGPGADGLVS